MILALLALGSPAVAQEAGEPSAEARGARAREIYENGTALYEEGLYEDAIAAFQESYRLAGLHPLLLNIANCYERLGRYPDAIAVLNRYRAFAEPHEREKIRTRIAEATRRMKAAPGYVPGSIQALPIPPLRGPVNAAEPEASTSPSMAKQ